MGYQCNAMCFFNRLCFAVTDVPPKILQTTRHKVVFETAASGVSRIAWESVLVIAAEGSQWARSGT